MRTGALVLLVICLLLLGVCCSIDPQAESHPPWAPPFSASSPPPSPQVFVSSRTTPPSPSPLASAASSSSSASSVFVSSSVGDCPDGFWGPFCNISCGANCSLCTATAGVCLACVGNLTWGPTCSQACPQRSNPAIKCATQTCKMADGSCSGSCLSYQSFGPFCNNSCPEHCLSGKCFGDTGKCYSGCVSSWWDPYYCNKSCSLRCGEDGCEDDDGACRSCRSGTWGIGTCNGTCDDDCEGGVCTVATGDCQKTISHKHLWVWLALGGAVVAMVLMFGLCMCCLARRVPIPSAYDEALLAEKEMAENVVQL